MEQRPERPSRVVQFVVKVSKFCNLRCDYCYEYDELGDERRMSLRDIEYMFAHIATYYRAVAPRTTIEMIWHGGEPLIHEQEYYHAIFGLQAKHFEGLSYVNYVQTNLTLLDESRIALLRKFTGVGVSIDLVGHHRLNIAGKPSQDRVLRNMKRLTEEGIEFGCITVITDQNIDKIDQIFHFYDEMRLSARVLPLFYADTVQNENHAINARRVVRMLCRLVDLTLNSETSRGISPVKEMILNVAAYKLGAHAAVEYDRGAWESLIIVNTNGEIFAQADAYQPGRSWGNVFHTPLAQLVNTPEHEHSVQRTNERMALGGCIECPHYARVCTGHPLGENHNGYKDALRADGRPICVVESTVYSYIEARLVELEQHRPTIWADVHARMRAKATATFPSVVL